MTLLSRARGHLLRCVLLTAICAFGLSCKSRGGSPEPLVCRHLPDVVYIGPGMFAGGTSWEYCDEASAKSYLAEASLFAYERGLAERGDPRWIALDGLFQRRYSDSGQSQLPETPGELHRWFDAAVRAGSHDPLIAWAADEQCYVLAARCDSVAEARRVVAAEPDNGAAHLLLAEAHQSFGNHAAAREEFARAASAKRFRTPLQGLMKLLLATLQGWEPPKPHKTNNAQGKACVANWPDCADLHRYWLAISLEEMLQSEVFFLNADAFCKNEKELSSDASLRTDCVLVFTAMADNDQSQLSQDTALEKLVQLTSGRPDGARWRERLRDYLWINMQYARLDGNAWKRLDSTREFFDAWTRNGLVAAMQARLVRNGIAVTPPPGWLPSSPRMRALIQTDGSDTQTPSTERDEAAGSGAADAR